MYPIQPVAETRGPVAASSDELYVVTNTDPCRLTQHYGNEINLTLSQSCAKVYFITPRKIRPYLQSKRCKPAIV